MPRSHYVATSPLRSRSMTDRPGRAAKAPLKAISRVEPAVVATAAADPAVLVDLHDDLRLSLGALAKTLGTSFTEHWQVAHLATGYVVLVPDAPDAPGLLDRLRVDPRQRLRLTAGVAHRLAVAVGGQVLVTAHPDGTELRLVNLGTLADAYAAHVSDQATGVPA